MTTKTKILVISGLVLVVFVTILFVTRSTIRLTVAPDSQITSINVAVDGGNPQALPTSLRLRVGKHYLVFSGPDAEPWEMRIRVWPPFPKTLPITLGTPELPGLEKFLEIPYLGLFPQEGSDYQIDAATAVEGEKVTIVSLTITAIHRFEGPQDGQAYIDERNVAVTAAKKWLKDNGVPDSIPITVVDL